MYETLPDVMADDRAPAFFLIGFSVILLALVAALAGIAIVRERARKAGIYRKYVTTGDCPNRRRVIE